jgi:hypothetical protein
MDLLHLAWLWVDGSGQLTWLERWRQTFGTNCKAPSYLNLHRTDGHSSSDKHGGWFLQKMAALKVKGDSGKKIYVGKFSAHCIQRLVHSLFQDSHKLGLNHFQLDRGPA